MRIGSEIELRPNELAMAPGPTIRVEDLSVRYRIPREKVSGVKEFAIRWLQRRLEYMELWALKDVNLDIYPGEFFGVVGRNGAGKSTLLKVIAGLLHPARGRVVVQGSVAPLLELGAGFHPELTGRENVYLYGTLLGMNREQIEGAFGDIVDFAELWDFIDSPLRAYSSGMTARLGFAVATCRFAEVLLVDEVLAVGDVQFQEKCLARMEVFRQQGATILFVSHAVDTVSSFCNRAAWIREGSLAALGPASEVVAAYTAS